MKKRDIFKFAEEHKNDSVRRKELEIDGIKIIVFSHFAGSKDLNKIISESAFSRASEEVLNRISL